MLLAYYNRIVGYLRERLFRSLTMSKNILKVKLNSPDSILPIRASENAAGYDLFSAETAIVNARSRQMINTYISVAILPGYYGRIAPRSGLALKQGIDVGGGVIDADYRGNVGVILFNHSGNDFEIKKGDRIAQLIIERIDNPDIVQVDDLDDTQRGDGGFGSTGI